VDSFLEWWEAGAITHQFFSIEIMREAFAIILRAFPVSLMLAVVAFMLGIPLGLALAFMKMAKTRWLRWPATAYVDVVRGTPLFLQILLIYFGLPLLPGYRELVRSNPWLTEPFLFGMNLTQYFRVFIVLSFNSSAYMAEIFRAGIQSISKGQMEAARSLGMTAPQSMQFVIIPQTIRRILPTMMSEFILLFKDTALLSAVGIFEMSLRARQIQATTLNSSAFVLAAFFYLLVTIPLGRLVARWESKLAEAEGGGGARGAPPSSEPEEGDVEAVLNEGLVPEK
jgi:polar amino acid transport system substrate-binding protein